MAKKAQVGKNVFVNISYKNAANISLFCNILQRKMEPKLTCNERRNTNIQTAATTTKKKTRVLVACDCIMLTFYPFQNSKKLSGLLYEKIHLF